MTARRGATLGSYILDQRLGRGGNAVVWLAEYRQDGDKVAVKILRKDRFSSEPLRRFIGEIKLLRDLSDYPGILPLIDYELPDNPSPKTPPWYAMPVADSLHELAKEMSLQRAVECVASLADTLAKLSDDGIHHRDLKPSNIFHLDDEWLLGDFGLATVSEREALTETGNKLGPMYYLAPEMLDAKGQNYEKADVFSLAKLLWVLVTGQRYPIPGELLIDYPGTRISSYQIEPRIGLIERLLYQATRTDPQLRPTMREFQKTLYRWLNQPLSAHNDIRDLSSFRERLEAATQSSVREEERREELSQELIRLGDSVQELMKSLKQRFKEAVPFEVGLGRSSGGPSAQIFEPEDDIIRTIGIHLRCASPQPNRFHLQADVSIRLGRNELVEVAAGLFLSGKENKIIWQSELLSFLLGSTEYGSYLQNLIFDLEEKLPVAIRLFTEVVERTI